MAGWLYGLLLASACLYVLLRGESELRVAATLLVATSLATYVNFAAGSGTFARLQPWLIGIETLALAIVLVIAYRSRRFWPLLFAATQIATLLSLLAPLFGRGLLSYALGVAQGLWAFPQLALLILATLRGRNRTRRQATAAS